MQNPLPCRACAGQNMTNHDIDCARRQTEKVARNIRQHFGPGEEEARQLRRNALEAQRKQRKARSVPQFEEINQPAQDFNSYANGFDRSGIYNQPARALNRPSGAFNQFAGAFNPYANGFDQPESVFSSPPIDQLGINSGPMYSNQRVERTRPQFSIWIHT